MSFRFVTADDQGNIYAVTEDGDLLYYRDQARNGTANWAFGGIGQKIGNGWSDFLQVFAAGDGVLYAIASNGDLFYYKDEARNGTQKWSFGGVGQKIGNGFGGFTRVFSGGDGIIYAISPNGDLMYYRDEARNGTAKWSYGGIGQKIGNGWADFREVISGGDGIIYATTADGRMLYYRDEGRDGTRKWSYGETGKQIGQGWSIFSKIFSGGAGIIYAITTDGFLLFYQDQARNGNGVWAHGGTGQTIGSGWFVRDQLTTVEGYCSPLAVSPGDIVEFKTSGANTYDVTYVRLKEEGADIAMPVAGPAGVSAVRQTTPAEPWKNGCGWNTSFSLQVPNDWKSGLYAARCKDLSGAESYIVFIVKPAPNRRNKIAILANTNTWNAYNSWGGRSKYDGAEIGSFERPNPGSSPLDSVPNHLTRAELWVLNWLENVGYQADVFSDYDFHSGIEDFADYKALILSTHPEYWTLEMLDQLEAYLSAGGTLLYLGGNGLFEQCVFNSDASALTFWGGNSSLGRDRNYFRNLNPPRPERSILGVAFLYNNYLSVSTPGPYRVEMADHPFFVGTGLSNGDLIGQTGRNGAASGWEIDTSDAGTAADGVIVTAWYGNDRGISPANLQILARGTNPQVDGPPTAHMTYYETANGGFVFSVGSLCFSGSLAEDPKLQAIVQNALNAALN